MARVPTKELKVFEKLEKLTGNDSFDSRASFVRKFVSGTMDLNSTYQSIPEGEGEEGDGDQDQGEGDDHNERDKHQLQRGYGNDDVPVGGGSGGGGRLSTSFSYEERMGAFGAAIKGVAKAKSRGMVSFASVISMVGGGGGSEAGVENSPSKSSVSGDPGGRRGSGGEEGVDSSFQDGDDDDNKLEEEDWSGSEGSQEFEEVGEEDEEEGSDYGEEEEEDEQSSDEAGNSREPSPSSTQAQYNTSYSLITDIKNSLELQQLQLVRDRSKLTEQSSLELKKLEAEKKQVEAQRQNLQQLIADYHKMKSSKVEHEQKVKELTEKLRQTKLETNRRISRWGEQQKKLEERVQALENENAQLKKQKSMAYRPALLKRPPLTAAHARNQATKLPKRIHFADTVNVNSSHNSSTSSDKPVKPSGGVKAKILKNPLSPSQMPRAKDEGDKENSHDGDSITQLDTMTGKEPANPREVLLSDDEADRTMPSDYVEVKHPCGTITRISKDNKLIRHVMVNKDIMDEFEDCSVRYHYADSGFSQITYPNGDEIIEYDGGILETHRADGTKIYTFSDGLVKLVDPSGSEEIYFPDGSITKKDTNGTVLTTWPSGQKEEKTSTYTKRTYPNGTVKVLYTDGSVETRYSNGRVRRKDKTGKLVDDTKKSKQRIRSHVSSTTRPQGLPN